MKMQRSNERPKTSEELGILLMSWFALFLAFAHKMGLRGPDAEDAVTDTIMHGFEIGLGICPRRLRHYLINKVIGWRVRDIIRRNQRRAQHETLHDMIELNIPDPNEPMSLEWAEDMQLIREALDGMDRESASILELRFYEGMTIPKLAAKYGVSLGSMSHKLRVAKAMLEDRLGGFFC